MTVTTTSNAFVSADEREAESNETIVQALRSEAHKRGWEVTFHENLICYSELGLLILPITIQGMRDDLQADISATLDLEESWNYQEPEPCRKVRLTVPWNPEIALRSTP